MLSCLAIDLLLYFVFLFILQRNLHVAFYVQLHIHVFRIICIDYSDLFTRCLNYYTKHSMSLHVGLPVTFYCSMHFRRHGGGSRSGSGLWLSDGWYVGLSCVDMSACMRGRTVDGVHVCNLRRRLNSVVYFTHSAYYIASTKAILSIASMMADNQTILENFGRVDANSLCQLFK